MSYEQRIAQQAQLESELFGRQDYLREAYAATAADTDLSAVNEDRADAEDNTKKMLEALLPTLSDDKLAKIERWFEAQMLDLVSSAVVVAKDDEDEEMFEGQFKCGDCKQLISYPHEGEFIDHYAEISRCIDCHIKYQDGSFVAHI